MLAAMRFAFLSAMAGGVAIAGVYACSSDDGADLSASDGTDAAPYDAGYVFLDGSPIDPDAGQVAYPPSSVALGEGFACVVAADRTVWCWGSNDVGQLGIDPALMTSTATPTQVPVLESVSTVVAGKDFACALIGERAWCWGGNAKNQILGGPTVASRFTPQVTAEGTGAVMAAGQHACILTTDGFLHCWGDNTCNLFGRADDAGVSDAFKVPNLPQMQQVSLGVDEICSVSPANETFCWGSDHNGSLGHDVTAAPTCNGLPFDGIPKQVAAPGGQVTFDDGVEAHVGAGLACARKTDNSVWCWGDNRRGGLGQGLTDTDNHVFPVAVPDVATEDVAVGGGTVCAIADNRVICWGDAQYGQMDSLGADAGCGGTGCRPFGYVIPGQEGARNVFVGPTSVATIKVGQSLWAWGKNDDGEEAVAPSDPADVPCANTSKCIPDPRQVTTAPPLD